MSGPLSLKPENYLDDPDSLLRQARKEKAKQVIPANTDSPPAPRPPNYSWRPEASVSGSPAALSERVVYASSFVKNTPESAQRLEFSPIELSPSVPEKTVIDLHFKKLLGPNFTPHPPGYLPQHTPLPHQSTSTVLTQTADPTNPMSREEDMETIRALRSQVEASEQRTALLDQSRQETANLQKLVREMLAEKSRVVTTSNPVETVEPGNGEPNPLTESNSFSRYMNVTPASPSPLPRVAQPPRAGNPLPQGSTGINPAERPEPLQPTDPRVNWADDYPDRQEPPGRAPVQSTPAGFPTTAAHPSPVETIYSPALHVSPGDNRVSHLHVPAPHQPSISQTPAGTTADRIKLSDLPKFTGKYGKPADLFHWRNLIEETFEIKNVIDDREKLKLLGSLLNDEEMSSWYQANKSELKNQSWEEAMELMAMGTLPYAWLTDTENALRRLEIKTGETFDQYVKRGQALYRLLKPFGQVSERHLAQHITWGAPVVVKDMIDKDKLLLAQPFSFPVFKDAADGIYRFLNSSGLLPDSAARSKVTSKAAPPIPASTGSTLRPVAAPRQRSDEERAENAWRYHEYLRQTGICPTCKEKCNNASCTRRNTQFLSVPADFNPGPRPRRAPTTTTTPNPPGAPTQRPAGRPPVTPAVTRVAAVEDVADMMAEDIAAYEDADQFQATQIEDQSSGEERGGNKPSFRPHGT